jgi:hypothetical protein
VNAGDIALADRAAANRRLTRSRNRFFSAAPNGGVSVEENGDWHGARGEIIINRPVEEVFGVVTDELTERRYLSRMLVVEQISEGRSGWGRGSGRSLRRSAGRL